MVKPNILEDLVRREGSRTPQYGMNAGIARCVECCLAVGFLPPPYPEERS